MATRNMINYIRKITRVGKRSLSIIIPADIVRELNFRAYLRSPYSAKNP